MVKQLHRFPFYNCRTEDEWRGMSFLACCSFIKVKSGSTKETFHCSNLDGHSVVRFGKVALDTVGFNPN